MDIRYGVDVSNKFDLFGFNAAVTDASRQKEEVRKTNKKVLDGDKPKLGSNKQNTKKPISDSKGKPNDQNVNKKEGQGKDSQPNERSSRGGRGFREPRENKENDGERKPFRRQPREQQQENRGGDENVPPEFREKPEGSNRYNRYDDGERGRGRGRGRGGFRGRGRGVGGGFGQPFERSGKRDFDRHSGSDKTGVKAVDKREGGGRRNWGSYKDDIKNVEESQQPIDGAEPGENWNQNEENPEPQENSGAAQGSPETVNEEDAQPKQMTLREYRATQEKNRVKAQFQIRKAGEGVDGSQWKDGTQIRKSATSAPKQERRRKTSESEEDEESDDEHEDKKKKNKNTLNIEITFNDNNRRGGRGGRRGRGNGRGFFRGGSSPRGGGRGGGGGSDRKYRDAAPRVDDEKDFPSLVKSVA